jgi:hypothetical protein
MAKALITVLVLMGLISLLEMRTTNPDVAVPLGIGLAVMYIAVLIQYWRENK